MKKLKTILLILFITIMNCNGWAQDKMVNLPEPIKSGGMPLMEALSNRKTSRDFSAKELDLETLSNLLWAANGINRPEGGLKTAPSAVNWQEIEIYVCIEKGIYLYNATEHRLELLKTGDFREATGAQPFVKDAPLNLIYVADFTRMGDRADDVKHWYSAADAAFIIQNVYLFCASEGMGTVVRGSVPKEKLKEVMNLPEYKHVVFAQSVGYPKE